MSNHLMTTYSPLPVAFTHGKGVWLWDTEGTQYLDALSGIAVCGLGHAHPAVTQAITEQASKLLHTTNLYRIPLQKELADELTRMADMEQAFFCNSGAEANEAALKLARLYGHKRGIDNPLIVVMEGAFHGRTLATLSASGNRRVQAGFEPLVAGFIRAPYNDIDALKTIAKQDSSTTGSQKIVAILVEPIQGEGGIVVPDPTYLENLRAICDQHDWLLMLDEVQTGVGRTGAFYAYQHTSIHPDVLTTAKGLGNGVPIGACLVRDQATTLFQPGNHATTFGGNPLVCSAALAVLRTIEKEDLATHAAKMGQQLLEGLQKQFASLPHVKNIRGQGLMIGIELDKPCRELPSLGLTHGLLFNVTVEKVVRLLPPLITTPEEIQHIMTRLTACIEAFYAD